MKLSDREWKAFKVKDIFDSIVPTKGRTTNELVKGEDIPYIAASKINNGYAGMYTLGSCRNMISKGNAIVFIQLGDGAAGMAYYEPMDFIGMKGKTSCGYFSKLNQYVGIFLARCLSVNKEKFSHGHSWTGSRLKNTEVMLPVTDDGEPDYQFMEDYVRELMIAKRKQYRDFVEKRLAELGVDVKNIGGGGYRERLDSREWKEFLLTGNKGLFSIVSTNTGIDAVRLKVRDDESVPYITRTELLNGIAKFVSKENLYFGKDSGGCITIGLDTQTAYWQTSDFITGQNIQILRSNLVNLCSGLFLIVVLKKQLKAKFNWGGNGATLGRLKKLKIMLPVTKTGEPDYEFMEEFGRKMMLDKYSQYLAFLVLSDTQN